MRAQNSDPKKERLKMRGRRPRPDALQNLFGRSHHKKKNKDMPSLPVSAPAAPKWLDPIARAAFQEMAAVLKKMGVMTDADKMALEMFADAYSEYRRARRVIRECGPTYAIHEFHKDGEIASSRYYKRPEVEIASTAARQCGMILKEFGLTPASRSAVQAAEEIENNPFDDFLAKGGIHVLSDSEG